MGLLVSTLRGMECILGMEFISHNNVIIEGHNRSIKIPLKKKIIWVKTHEMPSVGGSTIHIMLNKTSGKKMHGRLWLVVCDVCVGQV